MKSDASFKEYKEKKRCYLGDVIYDANYLFMVGFDDYSNKYRLIRLVDGSRDERESFTGSITTTQYDTVEDLLNNFEGRNIKIIPRDLVTVSVH